jgi:hypothetical protein
MAAQASGTFLVGSWDEKPVLTLDGGGKLTRASIGGSYTGDLEGESTSENVMCYRADGTATYVGLERFVGRIGGRSGSFVLQTTGGYDGQVARATLSIVPGSGAGELAGLRGEGRFEAPHGPQGRLELDYRFD